MKRLSIAISGAVLAVMVVVSGCSREALTDNPQAATNAEAAGQPAPFAKPDGDNAKGMASRLVPSTLTVPSGTPVAVRLQASLSSATSQAGQQFDAVLEEPLVVNGQTVAEKGASVIGRVAAARPSGHLKSPGYLRLTLASVEINGRQVPLRTSSVSAVGASHKKRNVALIGGGTGAGALIGALAGGGKGALIGGAVGAGAGTTAAYATGKKDVGFVAERRLTFRLVQPLSVRG